MWNFEKVFLNKKPNFNKLTDYGFSRENDFYIFSADITGNMFRLDIRVTDNGKTEITVTDNDSNEEYILIFSDGAVGTFVANVRAECEEILKDISEKCFDLDVFKGQQTKLISLYIEEKYGIKAEHLWENSPCNAIFRHSKSNKWFAVLQTIEKQKLGVKSNDEIEILNLKETPENVSRLVDGKRYFTGFHMNKKHWYTVCLDKTVPIEEIYRQIDKSYNLINKQKTAL